MVFSYEEFRMKDYIGWGVAQFWKNIMNMFDLQPRKQRMEKQRWMKMYFLLKMVFFKSRVSFQGCMYIVYVSYYHTLPMIDVIILIDIHIHHYTVI